MIGGIKNAMERGVDIVSAQKTFINAGYSTEEVAAAAKKLPQQQVHQRKDLSKPVKPEVSKKHSNKTWLWITGIISILILMVAVILGFYWDKFF